MTKMVRRAMAGLAKLLNRLTGGRLTPNAVTYTSLLGHVVIAYLLATGHVIWAGGLLIIFGLMDTLDGELARLQNRAGPQGMLLDSVTDRVKEILLYVGAAYFLAHGTNPQTVVWAVAACGTSLLVSYLNAWGEVVIKSAGVTVAAPTNKTFRGGLMSFEIRMLVVIIGLFAGQLVPALIVLTLLSAVTVVQRYTNVKKTLKRRA